MAIVRHETPLQAAPDCTMEEKTLQIPRCNPYEQPTVIHKGMKGTPVRFTIVEDRPNLVSYIAEVTSAQGDVCASILEFAHALPTERRPSNEFVACLIIPTGMDCQTGGHAGDGGPIARLIASCVDRLVVHPNVVNGSDINEMPSNALYVEGSTMTRLLANKIKLRPVRTNKIACLIEQHETQELTDLSVNMCNAAWADAGINVTPIVADKGMWSMRSEMSPSGRVVGSVDGIRSVIEECRRLVHKEGYEAIALSSTVDVSKEIRSEYYRVDSSIPNPWGGCESMLTHAISLGVGVPCAHAPMVQDMKDLDQHLGVVDPKKAAEAVSLTNLFSVIKGLSRSPAIINGDCGGCHTTFGDLHCRDIDVVIMPSGCVGLPTFSALLNGITYIEVTDINIGDMDAGDLHWQEGQFLQADSYIEAAGLIQALKAGLLPNRSL